jgi:hypothetical protein
LPQAGLSGLRPVRSHACWSHSANACANAEGNIRLSANFPLIRAYKVNLHFYDWCEILFTMIFKRIKRTHR